MNEYRSELALALSENVITLFATISRMEFALKHSGYCNGVTGGKAEPNWDRFANSLGSDFFSAIKDKPQVAVLFREPPRLLRLDENHEPVFQDQVPATNCAELFVAVRRVRNNLFHGEKASLRQRDSELVDAALFVLDTAMADCRGPLYPVAAAFAFAELEFAP